ncbi:MAG: hypothetical protein ACK4N5_06320 [Myxococcales bacterium]
MAIPPEPIEEVLPKANAVVEAEVVEVVSTGPAQPQVEVLKQGMTSVPQKLPSQVVKLKVTRVLKGPTDLQEVVAEKPVGDYMLRAGNKGPWLLDASQPKPVILGRYGPDSWSLHRITEALKARQ